jgi:hypothetical protein
MGEVACMVRRSMVRQYMLGMFLNWPATCENVRA